MNTLMVRVNEKENGENGMGILCYFCGEPIVKMNGKGADAYCGHHISYSPEVIVPAHIGCNASYHSKNNKYRLGSEKSLRRSRTMDIILVEEELVCHFCNDPITKLGGTKSNSLLIHSLDGNHYNWDPVNKVPAHRGCHQSYHMFGKPKTLECRQKLREANLGKTLSEEHIEKLRGPRPHTRGENNPMYGKSRTEEWRKQHSDRMSGEGNPMYGKHHSEETKQKIRIARAKQPPSMLGKHHTEETKEKLRKARRGRKMTEHQKQNMREAWVKRREKYPPNGVPEDFGDRIREGKKKSNPSGRELK